MLPQSLTELWRERNALETEFGCTFPPTAPPPPSQPPLPSLPPVAPLGPDEVAVTTAAEMEAVINSARGSGAEVRLAVLPAGATLSVGDVGSFFIEGFNLTVRAHGAIFDAGGYSGSPFVVNPSGGGGHFALYDATVKGGKSLAAGGGIMVISSDNRRLEEDAPPVTAAELVLEGVQFLGCQAQNGAAIYVEPAASVSLRHCRFVACNCLPPSEGAHIAAVELAHVSTVAVTDCSFDQCSGAALCVSAGHMSTGYANSEVESVTLLRCSVYECGWGKGPNTIPSAPLIFYDASALLVADTEVTACAGVYAGAVYANMWGRFSVERIGGVNAEARFERCTVRDCKKLNYENSDNDPAAGGIYLWSYETLSFSDCLFERCGPAARDCASGDCGKIGGTVVALANLAHLSAWAISSVIMGNCTVRECSGDSPGVHLMSAVVDIEDSHFEGNRARDGVTAIALHQHPAFADEAPGSATLRGVSITDCSVDENDGVPFSCNTIDAQMQRMHFYGLAVVDCHVGFGGGVHVEAGSGPIVFEILLDDLLIERCSANLGGAIHFHNCRGYIAINNAVPSTQPTTLPSLPRILCQASLDGRRCSVMTAPVNAPTTTAPRAASKSLAEASLCHGLGTCKYRSRTRCSTAARRKPAAGWRWAPPTTRWA